jgi:MFS transporter, putative metabolite transport protein
MTDQNLTKHARTPPVLTNIHSYKSSKLRCVEFEESELRAFHIRVALSGSGGQLSDGFVLGIIGITIGSASSKLHLSSIWVGAIGAASLAGLFMGALFSGPIVDRLGRRPIFAWDMLVFSVLSMLQFFVTSAEQLLVLRVLLGLTLGADYVASKSLVTEYCPYRLRGRLLSVLAVAWAFGYSCAYCVGFALRGIGPEAWRWMLLSSAIPSAVIFPLRIGVPESPLWLVNHGRLGKATNIVAKKFGDDILPPRPTVSPFDTNRSRWRILFSPAWRSRTLVACLFYTCQVIPYFALGTFAPRILSALNVRDAYLGGFVYALFLLAGAVLGLLVVDRLSRRSLLIGSFYICSATLSILSVWNHMPSAAAVVLISIFAGVLGAAVNLNYVYTPELFPTELRASGVGLAVAASRVGSATATFLLPLAVQEFGIRYVLVACILVLLAGGVGCQLWAPETREVRLASLS